MHHSIILILLGILVGASIPLQAAANAKLGQSLGQPLWSAAIALSISALVAFCAIAMTRSPRPPLDTAFQVPAWCWLGGLSGAAFVISGIYLLPKIGAAQFLVATVVGQLILAVVIDHNGWLGVATKPIELNRLIGLALVLVGTALVVSTQPQRSI